jgi:hypothetical protein
LYWRGADFITSWLKNSHCLQLLDSKLKNFANAFTSWAVAGVAASKFKGTNYCEGDSMGWRVNAVTDYAVSIK